jgi:hypothetical protein
MGRPLALSLVLCTAFVCSCARTPSENVLEVFARHSATRPGEAPPPFALYASPSNTPGAEGLLFTMRNISSEPIELDPSELPWGNANSLAIAVVALDGKSLRNYYPIDDPVPAEPITLAPGQELKGRYSLSNRIDPATLPLDTDVLVLWSYRLHDSSSQEYRTYAPVNGITVFRMPK